MHPKPSRSSDVPRTCEVCGIAFYAHASSVRKGMGQYCSIACSSIAHRTAITTTCEYCGACFRHGPTRPRRFCSRTCYYAASQPNHDATAARFWAKVDRAGECWLWTRSRQTNGYGQVRVNGRAMPAHRFSYETTYGSITDPTLYVCHHCDEPLCVRPDHLFLGTPADNIHDMMAKGRQNMAGQAKLTDEQRDEIRALTATGQHSQRALAHRFGVTNATINRVIGQRQRAQIKLTRNDVRAIRQLAADGMTQRDIAERYGASQAHISNIVRGLAWPNV